MLGRASHDIEHLGRRKNLPPRCLDQTPIAGPGKRLLLSLSNLCGALVNGAFHRTVMKPSRDIIKSKSRQNWAEPPGKS